MAKAQDKGEALRKRVLALFEKMLPFNLKTVPTTGSTKEKSYYLTPNKILFSKIDVAIEDEKKVFLVIECKSVEKKPTLQDLADRVKRIKEDQKAKSGLLIISGPPISDDERKDILTSHGVYLWNEELLSYYEKLASTLGRFSFFEIMKDLGISLEEESGNEFRPALCFEQKVGEDSLKIISFTATPRQMIKRAYVFRHANKKVKSYQRLIKKAKLKSISDYITDGGNIINSVLVLLPEECKFEETKLIEKEEKDWYYGENIKGSLGKINLPKKYCFIEVIDGQHRLFSFTQQPEGSDLIANFPLNFVGIQGGNNEIARDLFMTINQNAKKIEANLLASIQEEWDKNNLHKDSSALAREIVRKLNREKGSALQRQILEGERLTKEHAKIKLYIAMLAYHGIRPISKKGGSLGDLIAGFNTKEYYDKINSYLKRLKSVFPEDYQDNEKYVVFTNNGLIPLLRLYGKMCKFYNQFPTNKQIDEILKLIRDYDWGVETIRGRSSGSGWKATFDDLVIEIKNKTKFKEF
jgi:DGQHR domain-containing protein